jgi:alkaline phosphatase
MSMTTVTVDLEVEKEKQALGCVVVVNFITPSSPAAFCSQSSLRGPYDSILEEGFGLG